MTAARPMRTYATFSINPKPPRRLPRISPLKPRKLPSPMRPTFKAPTRIRIPQALQVGVVQQEPIREGGTEIIRNTVTQRKTQQLLRSYRKRCAVL